MRKFFFAGTGLFWCFVLGVWAIGAAAPGNAPAPPAEPVYPLAEVARHATENDCWMAIHGKVYDLTAYLPEHPTRPSIILPWCGKESSEAYDTKTKGRPHSPGSHRLLEIYRIGQLAD